MQAHVHVSIYSKWSRLSPNHSITINSRKSLTLAEPGTEYRNWIIAAWCWSGELTISNHSIRFERIYESIFDVALNCIVIPAVTKETKRRCSHTYKSRMSNYGWLLLRTTQIYGWRECVCVCASGRKQLNETNKCGAASYDCITVWWQIVRNGFEMIKNPATHVTQVTFEWSENISHGMTKSILSANLLYLREIKIEWQFRRHFYLIRISIEMDKSQTAIVCADLSCRKFNKYSIKYLKLNADRHTHTHDTGEWQ